VTFVDVGSTRMKVGSYRTGRSPTSYP